MKRLILTLLLFFVSAVANAEELIILHTSDVHGRLMPIEYKASPNMGGFARRVTYFNDIRNHNKNVLIFDSGDYYQGSIFYRIFKGSASAQLMKEARYDAVTFGNHEFDDSIETLKKNVKLSNTPYVSCNLEFKDEYLKNIVKPYIVKSIAGKKILITGVTTQKLSSLANINGVTVYDPIPAIRRVIAKEHPDKVIVLSHCGLTEDELIARLIPNVSLILGGHNHYFFDEPKYVNKVPIVQSGEFGIFVHNLKIDLDTSSIKMSAQLIDSAIPENQKVVKELTSFNKIVDKYKSNVIAKTTFPITGEQSYIESNQSELGKLVLKSISAPVKNFDAVIINSGSIRLNRNLEKDITEADILEITPFDDYIVYGQIRGVFLKRILSKGQASGRRYLQYYSRYNIDEIEGNELYTVITSNYLAKGCDGYQDFKYIQNVKSLNLYPSILIKQFLLKHSNLKREDLEF